MTLTPLEQRMAKVLAELVHSIDVWNDEMQRIIGRFPNYNWEALEEARELIKMAEEINDVNPA